MQYSEEVKAKLIERALKGKDYCSAMPGTATWPVKSSTKGRWTRWGSLHHLAHRP